MNILHYSLGFPPYRSGGMTTYCISLIEEQSNKGHNVAMLWPGSYSLISSKTKIVCKKHKLGEAEINSYEIKNGLPVALLNGIRETKEFRKQINKKVFVNFFKNINLDVLHVHTLMGLPIECIQVANECGIKTVFTSHDSFGICFKQGLFFNGEICEDHECIHCFECNATALNLRKISVLQSPFYRNLKDFYFVKLLRRHHNKQIFTQFEKIVPKRDVNHAEDYLKLRKYYVNLLNTFCLVHYNSSLMKQVYESFGVNTEKIIFPVSHSNIKPNYLEKKDLKSDINIGYFGALNTHKGYYFLINVLNTIFEKNKNFKLHIYNEFESSIPYLVNHKPYKYDELKEIMRDMDLVVVPSQGFESYGFNTVEALSYGIPVIVTENVGAKDLIKKGKNGYIEKTYEDWVKRIIKIIDNPCLLLDMNKYICNDSILANFKAYSESLINAIYK